MDSAEPMAVDPAALLVVVESVDGVQSFPAKTTSASHVVRALGNVRASLAQWQLAAYQYRRAGELSKAEEVLRHGVRALDAAPRASADVAQHGARLLVALACHLLDLASGERDEAKRRLVTDAGQQLNSARTINTHDPVLWTAMGVYFMLSGRDGAASHFNNAVSSAGAAGSFVPGLLGKATLEMANGKYESALALFSSALQSCPSAGAAVRVAMGVCYDHLGRHETARACFARALEVEPSDLSAALAVAVYDLNEGHTRDGVLAMNAIAAHAPTEPLALLALASHCFYTGALANASKLAYRAYEHAICPEHAADALVIIARVKHFEGQLPAARELYRKALQHHRDSSVAAYGLAQTYHEAPKENMTTLLGLYRGLASKWPESFEVARALADIESHAGKPGVEEHLRKALKLRPDDPHTLLALAVHVQTSRPVEAAELYERLVTRLRDDGLALPPALLNNLGVMLHEAGRLAESETALCAALVDAAGEPLAQPVSHETLLALVALPANSTVLFNMGRLRESQLRLVEATELAVALHAQLAQEPLRSELGAVGTDLRIDCLLRHGLLLRRAGKSRVASEVLREAIGENEASAPLWTLIGQLALERRELQPADSAFQRVVKKDPNDAFALVALGNLNYSWAKAGDSRRDRFLAAALAQFQRVLDRYPRNAYAANGLGMVLAEIDSLEAGQAVFERVRETTADFGPVWVNLGHCYLGRRMWAQAAHTYERALERFYSGRDSAVMALIARAYTGARKFADARRWLQRAVHLDPRSKDLRFDLALVCQLTAAATVDRPAAERTLGDVEDAIRFGTIAVREFRYLLRVHVTKAKECIAETLVIVREAVDTLPEARLREAARAAAAAAQAAELEALVRGRREAAERAAEQARLAAAREAALVMANRAQLEVAQRDFAAMPARARKRARAETEDRLEKTMRAQDRRRKGGRDDDDTDADGARSGGGGGGGDGGGGGGRADALVLGDDEDENDSDFDPDADAARDDALDALADARLDAEDPCSAEDDFMSAGRARKSKGSTVKRAAAKRARRLDDDDDDDDDGRAPKSKRTKASKGKAKHKAKGKPAAKDKRPKANAALLSDGSDREQTPVEPADEAANMDDLFGDLDDELLAEPTAGVADTTVAVAGVKRRIDDDDDDNDDNDERGAHRPPDAKRARSLEPAQPETADQDGEVDVLA